MQETREFIKRAIDSTNGFGTYATSADYVNPKIWDRRLKEFQEKLLVITPLAEFFDFRQPGVDLTVNIDEEPSAAAALTETVDVTISAFSTRTILFTPTEYGAAYQLSRKEAVRAFFNVAERMTRKLAYSMAVKKDALAYAEVIADASTNLFVNSKTAATALASTDTFDVTQLNKAARTIIGYQYIPDAAVISPKQQEDLLNVSNLFKANEYGSREVILNGFVGRLAGFDIYVSHSVTNQTGATGPIWNEALCLGKTMTGEKALGYALKRDPIIEREYHARGRYWDIVGHEEYDFESLHPKAMVTIGSYFSATS